MKTAKKAATMDPLIEGYLGYLDKVGRKVPRTIVDVRCTLRRAISGLEKVRPGVELWHLKLEDYLALAGSGAAVPVAPRAAWRSI